MPRLTMDYLGICSFAILIGEDSLPSVDSDISRQPIAMTKVGSNGMKSRRFRWRFDSCIQANEAKKYFNDNAKGAYCMTFVFST